MPKKNLFKQALASYAEGHWTRTPPTKPGVYVALARDTSGCVSQFITAYEVVDQVLYTQVWSGWWWSEPLPTHPETPDTLAKSGKPFAEVAQDLKALYDREGGICVISHDQLRYLARLADNEAVTEKHFHAIDDALCDIGFRLVLGLSKALPGYAIYSVQDLPGEAEKEGGSDRGTQ